MPPAIIIYAHADINRNGEWGKTMWRAANAMRGFFNATRPATWSTTTATGAGWGVKAPRGAARSAQYELKNSVKQS